VTGEVVTAAQLNTHLRDNLTAVGPHGRIYKTANQTYTGTTFVNDTHLLFPIGANEVWLIDLYMKYLALTANDIKFAWAMPSGYDSGTSQWGGYYESTGATAVFWGPDSVTGTTFNVTSASPLIAVVRGILVNGATAGTAQLQGAEAAGSSGATFYQGSWLAAHRVG
jgi:hypothetical protein